MSVFIRTFMFFQIPAVDRCDGRIPVASQQPTTVPETFF
jgi:hypothetical protein